MFDLINAALVCWIKTPDAFNFIAKEIEAKADFATSGKQINNAAAYREFASVGDGVDAEIAVGLQQRRKPFAANLAASS